MLFYAVLWCSKTRFTRWLKACHGLKWSSKDNGADQMPGLNMAGQRRSSTADPRKICTPHRVPGTCYVATYVSAVEMGWNMAGIRPLGRQGQFVEVEESWRGRHRFLSVPALDEDFRQKRLAPSVMVTSTWDLAVMEDMAGAGDRGIHFSEC